MICVFRQEGLALFFLYCSGDLHSYVAGPNLVTLDDKGAMYSAQRILRRD